MTPSPSPSDRIFSRGIKLGIALLILLGAWFCFLAFTLVRAIVWWMLYHIFGIAFFLVVVLILASALL